ncbi:MAG: helix-turn-helix transcriptional regulator [Gammaproteobacteria bacterium]
MRQVNITKDNKTISVLCVGGRMRDGVQALTTERDGVQLLFKTYAEQGKERGQGAPETDLSRFDILLLFMAGSGWDLLERLRLPEGIAREKPLVIILDRYDHDFALALLKWGAEEVLSSVDCTPERLRHSILSAMTRFHRNRQTANSSAGSNRTFEQTALRTLDALPFGIMFTDVDARVMFMNSAAKKSCVNGSGVYISKDQRCCAKDQKENIALHRLISKISHESDDRADGDYTLRITSEDGSVLTLLVVTVGKESAGHGVAIFMDNGGGFFNISEETLRSVYGLTQSETELLLRMVQGETLAEISEARKVTLHTVRAQLKSVFAKTDTNRQASLIKKVLTGPAVLMQR